MLLAVPEARASLRLDGDTRCMPIEAAAGSLLLRRRTSDAARIFFILYGGRR